MGTTLSRPQSSWKLYAESGDIALGKGQYRVAEQVYTRALEEAEKEFGRLHGETGLIVLSLIHVLERLGKGDQAAPLYDRVREIISVYLEDDDR